jgi:hypothetical protein
MLDIDSILYDLFREQMDNIKSNPEVLDLIFDGKPTEKIEQIKQFLLNQKIRIVMHHPRDAQDFPCYSIILEGSTESEQVIGAADYDEIPISNMEDGWIGSDSDIFINNIVIPYPTWAASMAYVSGQMVKPSIDNDLIYRCMVSGTSGTTEPTWGTTLKATTVDVGVTWICILSTSYVGQNPRQTSRCICLLLGHRTFL